MKLTTAQNHVTELTFTAASVHSDPYQQVEMDVVFTPPSGAPFRVPAFWAGEQTWKARFSGALPGEYRFETSSAPDDAGLDGQRGEITVTPYSGPNSLLRHGRLRVAADKRHFEQTDGTPFFWTGDTWWMGLCTRLDWPQGFKELTADRVAKGFNVIQIIAGPYPDMDAWDPRGRNEAGFPFTEGFASISPAYYEHADLKIGHLVQSGLMPCIVGMWGYYLPQLGVDRVKRFWRYLVARYGAYPVTWCLCGEGTMPWYLSQTREADAAAQKRGWTEVMRYVREIDGYHNLISIHPTQYGREQVEDPALMDFEMLQTGHGDLESVSTVIESVRTACAREPLMPVVNSEVNYEGILGRCWQNIQRLCFYHSVMNGAAGYTYGANGIWQMSTLEQPYGPSPHGNCWGNTPWAEAAQLPGGRQVGLGGAFWRRFPWWEFTAQPDWVGTSKKPNDPYGNEAAGVPGKTRVIYIPMCWGGPKITAIEPGVTYRAQYFDPCTGADVPLDPATADANGSWTAPLPPEVHDWLLVLERKSG
jgi:hypothetical protein